MSNSVNNLKNCFFYLFVLCFFSSCVVEERYEVNDKTGLEWTFKKYRNGDESITLCDITIKGKKVEYFSLMDNMFQIHSDSVYIYKATQDSLIHVGSVPVILPLRRCQPVSVLAAKRYGGFLSIFCSDRNDFWVECINQNGDFEVYRNDGVYVATVPGWAGCLGYSITNGFHDDEIADYYKIKLEKNETKLEGVFDVHAKEVIPIRYKNVSHPIFWNYLGKVNNNYYFAAEKGSFICEDAAYQRTFSQYFDIYSQTGELLLSIDNQNNLYVANGKQYSFSNSKIEYKSSYEEHTYGGLWDEIEDNDTFKGSALQELKVYSTQYPGDEDWRSVKHGYYYTMIEDIFYIIHTEHSFSNDFPYIIESIRIPIEATTGKNNISKSSPSSKSALDMVRDVLMTDITESFFKNPNSYFIKEATTGKRIDTYEKGESFLIIGNNRMTTQWADGSGRTNEMAPKNITISDLDGEYKTSLAYVLDNDTAVRAYSSGGTKFILLYTYNKSMKSYVQTGSYTLHN